MSFFVFVLLIMFLPLPHVHLSSAQEVCNDPDEAGQSQSFKFKPL
jgi:hypothetical protein